MNLPVLKGLIAAPYTPMDKQGGLNLDTIDKYADHLIENGVSGVFVCGTTGEWPSLSTEERKAVLEKWISAARGKLKVISHVGGNSVYQSIELASHASRAGAYAIGSLAPSFFKPGNVKELVSFLAPVAGAAPDLPFFYYHIPSLTGVHLNVSELMVAARESIPTFAGVKFTHWDLYDMQKCMAFDEGRYTIFHGFDEILLCGLSLGIQAAVGSTYNYIPALYLKIWDAFNRNDFIRARELQMISVRIVDILNRYGGATAAGKVIMKYIGIDCGDCRNPLRKLTEDEKEAMKMDLKNIGFFNSIGHN